MTLHTSTIYPFPASRSAAAVRRLAPGLITGPTQAARADQNIIARTAPTDARRALPLDLPEPPRGTDQLVADMLLAMERAPWCAPVIATRRGIDRVTRVHVAVASQTFLLDADDARLAARVLIGDQAFVGCGEVAALLRDAAGQADRGRLRTFSAPRTGGLTLVSFVLLGLVFGGIAVAGLLAGLSVQ